MAELDQIERWQLEGNAPEAYEQYLVPAIFTGWAVHLVDQTAFRPGEHLLDVACGTGIVARIAAMRAGTNAKVVGVDINEAMLSVARDVTSESGLSIALQWADAAQLPYANGSFDVVCCQQALQFFPDPSAALVEMHRVLVPGGRLALNVLRSIQYSPAYAVLSQALEKHAGKDAGAMMRSPFPQWSIEQLRDLVTDAKFSGVRITSYIQTVRFPSAEEFLRREASSSPLAGPIGALSNDTLEELLYDLKMWLGEYTDDEGVVFPIETFIVIAKA